MIIGSNVSSEEKVQRRTLFYFTKKTVTRHPRLQAQSLQHDSLAGILASVEVGTGVAIGMDVFGYSFGNRVKVLDLIPEPKPISIGVAALKGKLSPAAEKILAVREGSSCGEVMRQLSWRLGAVAGRLFNASS